MADPLDERALLLFSHLLSSSHMWLSRVKTEDITTTLFQERTLEGCELLLNENTNNWIEYIDQANDEELNRIIQFTFPIDGTQKKMSVINAIMHIVHHSSYHRGQIVSKLKGCVEELPLVTYIVYAFEEVK
ncbi:MAG: DinB family protein [Bacteroidetes bacterium]|nr:DinB family protein [Bacteroidota bacterium]